MKWVCAMDFLLFDFPIWISAGWMDALLLLLQLRNSLSEFGPAVIRTPPPTHPLPLLITTSFHMQALRYLRACSLTKTWTITRASANYYNKQRMFKHWQLHRHAVGGGGCKQERLTSLKDMWWSHSHQEFDSLVTFSSLPQITSTITINGSILGDPLLLKFDAFSSSGFDQFNPRCYHY